MAPGGWRTVGVGQAVAVKLILGATLFAALVSPVRAAGVQGRAELRASTHVEVIAHGLRLSLTLQRTAYLRNAIVPAIVTLQNRSSRAIRFGWSYDLGPTIETVPRHCTARPPQVARVSLMDSCFTTENAYIFSGSAPGTGNPGPVRAIAPHQIITLHLLFVARTPRIRAIALRHGPEQKPGIATPVLTLRLIPGRPPPIRLTVGKRVHVRAMSPQRPRGRLLAAGFLECSSYGRYSGEGLFVFVDWRAGRNNTVWLGPHLPCSAHLRIRIAAGWLNQPAAIMQYVRKGR